MKTLWSGERITITNRQRLRGTMFLMRTNYLSYAHLKTVPHPRQIGNLANMTSWQVSLN